MCLDSSQVVLPEERRYREPTPMCPRKGPGSVPREVLAHGPLAPASRGPCHTYSKVRSWKKLSWAQSDAVSACYQQVACLTLGFSQAGPLFPAPVQRGPQITIHWDSEEAYG